MVRPLMASRDGVRRAAWWHPPITSSRFRARLVVRCVGRDVWPHAPSLFPGYGHASASRLLWPCISLSAPLAMHQPLRYFGHAPASPLLWPCTSLSATSGAMPLVAQNERSRASRVGGRRHACGGRARAHSSERQRARVTRLLAEAVCQPVALPSQYVQYEYECHVACRNHSEASRCAVSMSRVGGDSRASELHLPHVMAALRTSISCLVPGPGPGPASPCEL